MKYIRASLQLILKYALINQVRGPYEEIFVLTHGPDIGL